MVLKLFKKNNLGVVELAHFYNPLVAQNSYMQMHGEIHTLRNQKLACHIHISTVILPLIIPDYLAISPRSATIEKQTNRIDKVSLISKKFQMKVNEYLPNLDVKVPV
jgi:hypothetical protein